jgi:phosphohistidine phosphatase
MSDGIELYLVRHAIAEVRGEDWPDDTKRPLSEEGRAKMAKQVAGLARIDVRIEEILTSPLVRTRQTAEILAEGLPGRPRITDFPALAPGPAAKEVLTALKDYAKRSRLALVGHEPGLGDLLAALIGTRRPITFKKGGVALVKVDRLPPEAGAGALVWFVTPKILRNLAR